jgi:pilus assembly protein CpaB
MNRRNAIVLAAAAIIGLFAVFLVNTSFNGVPQMQASAAATHPLAKVVVARQALDFGTQLTDANLRLADWPEASVPAGAFTNLPDALKGGRVALRPIEAGEPVLVERVSGPDGHASIAANIPGDMRAVSISVSAVTGVGGFVTPGDVVDIFLTRQIPGEGASGDDKMTSVVLENVQVIGVDQQADEKKTEPKVSKTATVLTDLYGAQKLALASQLGTLSLALRNVQNQEVGGTKVVTARDLGGAGLRIAGRPSAPPAPSRPVYMLPPAARTQQASATGPVVPRIPAGPSMTIYRGVADTQYEVQPYGLR